MKIIKTEHHHQYNNAMIKIKKITQNTVQVFKPNIGPNHHQNNAIQAKSCNRRERGRKERGLTAE